MKTEFDIALQILLEYEEKVVELGQRLRLAMLRFEESLAAGRRDDLEVDPIAGRSKVLKPEPDLLN